MHIFSVYYAQHKEFVNKCVGLNAEFLNVKSVGTKQQYRNTRLILTAYVSVEMFLHYAGPHFKTR